MARVTPCADAFHPLKHVLTCQPATDLPSDDRPFLRIIFTACQVFATWVVSLKIEVRRSGAIYNPSKRALFPATAEYHALAFAHPLLCNITLCLHLPHPDLCLCRTKHVVFTVYAKRHLANDENLGQGSCPIPNARNGGGEPVPVPLMLDYGGIQVSCDKCRTPPFSFHPVTLCIPGRLSISLTFSRFHYACNMSAHDRVHLACVPVHFQMCMDGCLHVL
jgi:hypothetical protein